MMKRSWSTTLPALALVALLIVLGIFQYRWLKQISESDGEKVRARVAEQTDRFAADLNREIQSAYFNFQTPVESWKSKDWSAFNERYDIWRTKTANPDLLTDFYFFEHKSSGPPLKYDSQTRGFAASPLTPELEVLKARFSVDETFRPVYPDANALILPIHNIERKEVSEVAPDHEVLIRTRKSMPPHIPEKFGFLVMKFDQAIVTGKLLPELSAKYFGGDEYRVSVADPAGNIIYGSTTGHDADATARLFDISADNFMMFVNQDLVSSIRGEKRRDVRAHFEAHGVDSMTRSNTQGTVKIELKRDDQPKASVFTATRRPGGDADVNWTLRVQHATGSIDTLLANTLRRNLALGFGLLFLLAAAVGAIIVSTQRAKMLAQRQIDFVSSVSHEFRTPLAVIYSAGENLADGVTKEQAQIARYGDLIKGEGKKLTGMVEQILDFAGARSGRKKYNFTKTSVADVVHSAIDECEPLIREKGVEVVTNIDRDLHTINADPAALCQAVQNLIVNSIKYGNGNSWVRLSAKNGGGTVKINVEDRGIGISKSDLKQIFEPFYRSSSVVDAQIHGNGLGLSLVRQIARAHGGKISVTSELGKGSNFLLEIPV